MSRYSRLVYPPPLLYGSFETAILTADLKKIENYRTLQNRARRIPLFFSGPCVIVARVTSSTGTLNGWIRAGSLAQCLYSLPGKPKKAVNKLYLDSGVFQFDSLDFPYYLEFWPYRWLSDYQLELWAKEQPLSPA